MPNLVGYSWDLVDTEYETFTAKTTLSFQDVEQVQIKMLVFGTQAQIDAIEINYVIDESYAIKIEPPGSYWHGIFGKKAETINAATAKTLEDLKKRYELNNNEVLIIKTK